MSLKFRDSSGVETPVAGLNGTSGELVPSVALMQSGTVNLPQQQAHSQTDNLTVTFTTPMPDTNYIVVFDTLTGNQGYRILQLQTKTVNGFKFSSFNSDVGVADATSIKWQAFKLMTDTVHQADAAHISQNTANFAPAFSEVTSYAVGDYCTYNNVLYRCTTAHTAGVWVAGHFTAVTVGEDLSSPPVIMGHATNVGGSTGNVYYYKSGKIVTVKFHAFTCEGDGTNKKVLSGLPAPISTLFFNLSGDVKTNTFDIDSNGNIYTDVSVVSTISIWDTFTYVCR